MTDKIKKNGNGSSIIKNTNKMASSTSKYFACFNKDSVCTYKFLLFN